MRIDTDIVIARPPEEVWAILGDLAGVTRWVPGIASARMEGTRRVCTMDDGAEIHEEITDFSDERKGYSYKQTVHPLGFRRSEGTLGVVANGGGARVVWTAEVDFADREQEAQLLDMLRRGYAAALQRLKEVAET
jgi:uncharacterized protein YndB with AHSA1/START domain